MDWFSYFDESALQNLQVAPTVLNLVLVLVLGQILSVHYRAFSKVLSNKRKFAPMLVFVAATTMLVISVVKTSLSLSLGLVGALSIIRFRTPIKEPEELAYLFLAVALGVGMGADQRLATAIMFFGILLYMAFSRKGGLQSDAARTLLHVSGELGGKDRDGAIKALLSGVSPHASEVDLRRVDVQGEVFDTTLTVDLPSTDGIGPMLDAIDELFPGASVSVVEADGLD
jgi:hypothetical protein